MKPDKLPPQPQAIERIFGVYGPKYPDTKSKLAYSRESKEECLRNGWKYTAEQWQETIDALLAL